MYRCATVARMRQANVIAKPAPMHCLGPPPNGKYAKRGNPSSYSAVQRLGANRSGLWW